MAGFPILKFQKNEIRMASFGWVPYQKLQKFTKIKNLTSPSFLAMDKHWTMVEKSSLPFNHPQNLQKWHCRRCIWENGSCFTVHTVFDREEDWCSLIKQRQFGHFHKVSFGIKICYGSAERGYGVEEEFVSITPPLCPSCTSFSLGSYLLITPPLLITSYCLLHIFSF